jgi:hypothetical protein
MTVDAVNNSQMQLVGRCVLSCAVFAITNKHEGSAWGSATLLLIKIPSSCPPESLRGNTDTFIKK